VQAWSALLPPTPAGCGHRPGIVQENRGQLTTYNYVVAGTAKWRPHLIRIIENNNLAIPAGLEAERLWVINGKDVWTTAFSDES
jgi:hypothetical protein